MPHNTVFVDVTIKRISPLEFAVVPSPKNKPHQLPTNSTPDPDLPEIEFHNHKDEKDGFVIHFELQGDTHGYFFPADEQDAVWSKTGADCPNKHAVREVFEPIQVVESGHPPERRTLIVKNLNPRGADGKGQGKFRYNLRVNNGGEPLNLDPPGDNTNGHGFYSDLKTSTATTFMVAGAAATVSYLFLARSFGLDGAQESAGIALLICLTLGFAIAALFFRFVSRD